MLVKGVWLFFFVLSAYVVFKSNYPLMQAIAAGSALFCGEQFWGPPIPWRYR